MDDKIIQRKLNQLVKIANELNDEAKNRYGKSANLFYESEGAFHILSEFEERQEDSSIRQSKVMFSSSGLCFMDCGSW